MKSGMHIIYYCLINVTFVFYVLGDSIAYVITSPGTYQLGMNFIAQPTDANDAVIKIQSNNVVLDMSGTAIIQHPLNFVTGLKGIEIAAGMHDINIKNCMITDLTGKGILINEGCNDIKIDSSYISGCKEMALECLGTATNMIDRVVVNNVIITDCVQTATTQAYGVSFQYVKNFVLENCVCLENGNATIDNNYGYYFNNVQFGRLVNCSSNYNIAAKNVAGFYVKDSQYMLFKCCRAFNNTNSSALATFSVGMYWDNADYILCDTADLSSNMSALTFCAGFYSNNGGNGNYIRGSIMYGNIGGTIGAGIIFSNQTNGIIERCEVTSNTATGGNGYGILLSGTTGNTNCLIKKNTITNNIGTVSTFGITDESTISTNCIIQNTAFNNGTNFSVTYPVGVTLPVIQGSLSNVLIGMPSTVAGSLSNMSINP